MKMLTESEYAELTDKLQALTSRNEVLERSHDPYRHLLDTEVKDQQIAELRSMLAVTNDALNNTKRELDASRIAADHSAQGAARELVIAEGYKARIVELEEKIGAYKAMLTVANDLVIKLGQGPLIPPAFLATE